MCVAVPQEMYRFGEMPLEERALLLKESASPGAPSEVGATVSLWLPVPLSVLEARCTWQRGVGREKAVKSRFGMGLGLRRPTQAPAAACATPLSAEV